MSSQSLRSLLARVREFAEIADYFREVDRACAESTWTHLEALREEVKKDRLEPTEGVLVTLYCVPEAKIGFLTIPVSGLLKDASPAELTAMSFRFSRLCRMGGRTSKEMKKWFEDLYASYKNFGVKNIVLALSLFPSS